MAGTVVVFDFDKTIIDCDSDNWVVDELGATELFESLLPTMPWNSLMDRMMVELHAMGKSIEDIADVLKRALWTLTCELKVVSDANLFFIETILEHHGLLSFFSEINTNPSYVDEEGKLRISPYHDFKQSSHGCPLCPPNMCKSMILERMSASVSASGKKRFIYLGDGKGDYCPSLRLTDEDFVMPRKNYPLWELISGNPDGEEQERVLLQLINQAISADASGSSQLLAIDCKFETLPMPARESLRQALPLRL
ncbi:unnamed protein product [Spirodela intermedia]|uniref:Uncharacterized protein n=1 Tax=Spirodela intermedia TaxID=51605 RepID=A0A7I8J7R1_SPIIN|nr:unnamed protein product [Spirodela intermedia]CAA6666101.1 unnamed protein product [Spirodela intermedia]